MMVSAKCAIVARHCVHFDHHRIDSNRNAPIHIKLPPLRTPNPHLTTNNKPPVHSKPIKHRTRKKSCSSSDIVRLMDSLSHPIPPDLYASLIKECTLTSDPTDALHLHAHLSNHTHLRLSSPLIRRMLFMHVSCGQLDIARNLFDKMPLKKDFLSWAIIIVGYFENSKYEEGISLFIDMIMQHNAVDILHESSTWVIVTVCLVKACVYSFKMGLGKQLHGLLLKLSVTDELLVNVSLMDFYGNFGCLKDADSVFNKLYHHNTVTWTAKIVNSCKNRRFYKVIEDFKEMGKAGIRRNSFTFSSVLRACSRMDDGGCCGKQVHATAIKLGLESDTFVQCGLIDMYGKCAMIKDAKRAFEMITIKTSTACWNALLMGYVRSGLFIEAIKLMYQMEAAQIKVNESLITHVKVSCGTKSLKAESS